MSEKQFLGIISGTRKILSEALRKRGLFKTIDNELDPSKGLKYSSVQAKDECCTQVMLTEENRRDNMREAANKKWCNPFYLKVTQFQALTGRTLFDFGKLTFKFQTGCWEISFICNKAFCFLKTLSIEAMIAIRLWTTCRQGISYVMQRNLNKSYYKINQNLTTSRHHRSLVAHLAQNLHLNT